MTWQRLITPAKQQESGLYKEPFPHLHWVNEDFIMICFLSHEECCLRHISYRKWRQYHYLLCVIWGILHTDDAQHKKYHERAAVGIVHHERETTSWIMFWQIGGSCCHNSDTVTFLGHDSVTVTSAGVMLTHTAKEKKYYFKIIKRELCFKQATGEIHLPNVLLQAAAEWEKRFYGSSVPW